MIVSEEEHLAHYGILRKSGRYPWGSGGTQAARNRSFLDIVDEQRKSGLTDAQIAKYHGITRNQLTSARTIALAEQKRGKILQAQRLKEKGYSNPKIGQLMGGLNESSVRALLKEGELDKTTVVESTSNMLKKELETKKYLDVGKGVSNRLGITETRLRTSVALLEEQGYTVHNIKIQQIGTGNYTRTKVLAPPGTTTAEVNKNRIGIELPLSFSEDGGRSYTPFQTPLSINSKRIKVNFKEDGGDEADGVIYLRPGAKDLDMGGKQYAQVRIAVDGTHFLKGMAVYKNDLPDGVDVVFNTNKTKGTPLKTNNPDDDQVFKPMKSDPKFPFGSVVRQITDDRGNLKSALNLVNEEGDWDKWSKTLSSQFLSKQDPKLIQGQLDLTHERRIREFDEINSLTNPVVRRELLLKFADETDSAAVHLKAAALPRQVTKVILPIKSIKPTEVYAPTLRDGDKVVLVRFPHAGRFEIPELTVNNKNREARALLGTGQGSERHDAIGIHHIVAQHLSGADFDGDSVLVIPNNRKSIKAESPLIGLKDFDPMKYKIPADSPIPRIKPKTKQQEMGRVSNLITDMTLRGADHDELARAVRHSMVVIDSEKHGLDYKLSEKENGIAALKAKYQRFPGSNSRGASTLISLARSEIHVPQTEPRRRAAGGPIDPKTGKKVMVPTNFEIDERKKVGGKYVDTGQRVQKKQKVERLANTDDAFTLSSGTHVENIYAKHSNTLKDLANQARKEAVHITVEKASPSARKTYAHEVASLNASLNIALKNAPRERQAQLIANHQVSQRRQANPGMDDAEIKKIKRYALADARARTNAQKTKITLTREQWNAIQARAISPDKLKAILDNADTDTVRRLALPKEKVKLTPTKLRRAEAMLASGYTQAEVADQLGIGLTTLKVGLYG